MVKNKKLLQTNILVSVVLIIGFMLTAIFSYRANYQASMDSIEQVSSLTAEGIYYQVSAMFTRPVNISLTMAHDSLLAGHLQEEGDHLDDPEYIETTKTYLETYQRRYGFDSVFLVSSASGRYYNYNGLDRILTEGNPENDWYFDLMGKDLEYSLEVDNDEVSGADNEITVFVNCKVQGADGTILGVVGVGIRIDYMKDILKDYEDTYGVRASLISREGTIEISTVHTGYEKRDWFSTYDQEGIRDQILGWEKSAENLELWTGFDSRGREKNYVVVRYIPELSWSLLVDQNTSELIHDMETQIHRTILILISVVVIVVVVITAVIRNFNKQLTMLMEERQAIFQNATEQMYDNIYELNITRNCLVGKRTEEYFESLGAKGLPYDQGLRVIAEKQIKEEYRDGYINTFRPENVIREFEAGKNHISYDFMITQDGSSYFWMRIDAYIFYMKEDDSIHMFIYRKNIDEEKRQEYQAANDEMTGFYSRRETERLIDQALFQDQDGEYAFFIFDIDNFKEANDTFGHTFGDECIRQFTQTIRSHFREGDILGRIGGDEFAAFIPVSGREWVEEKGKMLSKALDHACEKDGCRWNMSASIGIAMAFQDGADFASLYRNADRALYQTKRNGKNGYSFYDRMADQGEK